MYDNSLVFEKCRAAKKASVQLASSSSKVRCDALEAIASALEENCERILSANAQDIAKAAENGVKETMIDRLTLNSDRVFAIANAVRKLIALPDVLGKGEVFCRPNGLKITKKSVIGMALAFVGVVLINLF